MSSKGSRSAPSVWNNRLQALHRGEPEKDPHTDLGIQSFGSSNEGEHTVRRLAEAGFPSAVEVDESLLGVYPLAEVNGHPAIDTFDLAPFLLTNGGGGAGGLAAAPRDYAKFFHALLTGGLLTAGARELLDGGYVPVAGEGFEHGFALFRFGTQPLGKAIVRSGQVAGGGCYHGGAVEAHAEILGSGSPANIRR